jgi:hypothetical protein
MAPPRPHAYILEAPHFKSLNPIFLGLALSRCRRYNVNYHESYKD